MSICYSVFFLFIARMCIIIFRFRFTFFTFFVISWKSITENKNLLGFNSNFWRNKERGNIDRSILIIVKFTIAVILHLIQIKAKRYEIENILKFYSILDSFLLRNILLRNSLARLTYGLQEDFQSLKKRFETFNIRI